MVQRMCSNVCIDTLRNKMKIDDRIRYLRKDGVLEWVLGDERWITKLSKGGEDRWGRRVIETNTCQWTTKLGEGILYEMLTLQNKNPKKITDGKLGSNNKRLLPDFEADDGIYENKARTYKTSGTAGEKILGTPLKYSECLRLFKKPLFIVCMGYQEKEADEKFQVFNPESSELKRIIEFYDKEIGIKYIKASDILKTLV